METQVSEAFDSIKTGLEEALEFSKGKSGKAVVHEYTPVDVKNNGVERE
jgi:putative transcriptional regulator